MGNYTNTLFKRNRRRSQSNPKGFKKESGKEIAMGYDGASDQERLVSCAIIRDNEIHSYGFKSHGDIRRRLGDENWSKSRLGDKEGFITSHDRFVDRDTANKIGAEAGQCQRIHRQFLSSDMNKW